MTEPLNITESTFDGVTVRSHTEYPMFRVTADGRVVGARGFWLRTHRQASGHFYLIYYTADRKQGYIHVHRLVALCYVLNPDPSTLTKVYHIDTDPANNHYTNLRWVTPRQNCQNLAKNKEGTTTSQYVGVGWHKKNQRWRAQIRLNGKNKGLGNFKDEAEAAKAYDRALISAGLTPVNFPLSSE